MVIKEYGREHDKKLLFLPGAFSNDSWYFPILELFGERWHTFVVIYDGYHEPYEKSFVGVEDSANKIVDFFKRRDIHGFDMVYGLSMGGAIANIIYANELLKMNILIIDGGVYPDNLPYILNRLHVFQNTLEVKIVRRSKRIMKMVYPPDRWLYPWEDEDSYKESMDFLNRLTNDTIKNCFDSCSNYKLPATFPKNDTKIYLFYGELEKKDMAWSIKSFRKTYPQAIYREFPDTDHGELSTIKYKECIQIIDEIAKK